MFVIDPALHKCGRFYRQGISCPYEEAGLEDDTPDEDLNPPIQPGVPVHRPPRKRAARESKWEPKTTGREISDPVRFPPGFPPPLIPPVIPVPPVGPYFPRPTPVPEPSTRPVHAAQRWWINKDVMEGNNQGDNPWDRLAMRDNPAEFNEERPEGGQAVRRTQEALSQSAIRLASTVTGEARRREERLLKTQSSTSQSLPRMNSATSSKLPIQSQFSQAETEYAKLYAKHKRSTKQSGGRTREKGNSARDAAGKAVAATAASIGTAEIIRRAFGGRGGSQGQGGGLRGRGGWIAPAENFRRADARKVRSSNAMKKARARAFRDKRSRN